ISELSQLSLRENASDDSAHAVSIAVSDDERITFQVGWARLNDVYITPDQLFVEARNGVSLVEPLSTVQSVLFTDGASQITRRDQSLRTLLPDGTDIETPIALPQLRECDRCFDVCAIGQKCTQRLVTTCYLTSTISKKYRLNCRKGFY
ncbi:MAG: hypothetical protein AAFQ52_21510, partial [Chloroflexota bacterium]